MPSATGGESGSSLTFKTGPRGWNECCVGFNSILLLYVLESDCEISIQDCEVRQEESQEASKKPTGLLKQKQLGCKHWHTRSVATRDKNMF